MATPAALPPAPTPRRGWWLAGLLLVGIALAGLWRSARTSTPHPTPTAAPVVTAVSRLGGGRAVDGSTPPPEAGVPIMPVLDAPMKQRLRAIHAVGLARGMRPEVLAKVGDSITVDGAFLADFGCGDGQLGAYRSLAPTIAYFRSTELPRTATYARCADQNSLTRVGPAAGNGWSSVHVLRPFPTADPAEAVTATLQAATAAAAGEAISGTLDSAAASPGLAVTAAITNSGALTATGSLAGTEALTATGAVTATLRPPVPTATPPPECQAPDNTPLRCEIKVIRPGVAIVMFGTNDLNVGFTPATFADNLDGIVAELVSAGVIPILSTIPPRTDDQAANARVSGYNMAAIAVAEKRGVPLVNFWRALIGPDMVGRGMEGDGIHPNDIDLGASFTPLGLRYGQNQRNLTTLQTLDKIRRIVYEDGPADAGGDP